MPEYVEDGGKRRAQPPQEAARNPLSEQRQQADKKWDAEISSIRTATVAHARSFIGMTYGADSIVCTDTYVRAAEKAGYPVSEEMRQHFADQGRHAHDVYSRTDIRYAAGVRQIKLVADFLRGNAFNNQPENEFFARRLQNLRDWQSANGVYWGAEEVAKGFVEPKEGMVVYWSPKNPGFLKSKEPTHVGVVSEVTDGKITKVVQASSSRGVVEDPHDHVLKSMVFVGVGDLPRPRAQSR